MASKAGNKSKMKKPVQTTLGKAAVTVDNPQSVDLSNVQKPIDTSVFGLRQVLSLFETATDEVRRYISYECDIIYECRICRSMYRSLANFILHKRSYCRDNFSPICNDSSNKMNGDLEIIQENEERLPETPKQTEVEKIPKKSLNAVLKRLCNKQMSHDENLLNSNKGNDLDELKSKIILEKISTNSAGVFQTLQGDSTASDLMKTEVMEIHDIFTSMEAVLGPDGKAIPTRNMKKGTGGPNQRNQSIVCTICNLKFSTKKTLTHHMRYKHNEVRVIYVCPECQDTFANAWSVFRHLYKIHHKSTTQIRKLRDEVHASAIEMKRDSLPLKPSIKTANINSFDQENQWINDVESDNDLQMCGGCGKRFERKAALNSHSHLCMKRLAVCNTLKKNKRIEIEDNCKRKTNTGALKRKPRVLKKPKQYVSASIEVDTLKEEIKGEVIAACEISDTLKFSNENVITLADFNVKSESNPHINEPKFQKTAIEEIIFGTTSANTISCSNIDLDENKEEKLLSFKDCNNMENIVSVKVSEISEQTLEIVNSYNCNASNHNEVNTTQIKNCDIQTFSNVETSLNCDNNKDNEHQLKEKSSNNLIQTINSDHFYISPKKNLKLPNILKTFRTRNNRRIKCDVLPSSNNNNEVQNIKKCLNLKTEEKNKNERSQKQFESKKRNTLKSIKEKISLNTLAKESVKFIKLKTEDCNEELNIEVNEELNCIKSDSNKANNCEQILTDASTEFDAKQSNEGKGLFSEGKEFFSLYDDNSNSLTNLEFSEVKIERESTDNANPNLICNAIYLEIPNSTTDMKCKKRKCSSDEEVDNLTLELKSKNYINIENLSCLPCNMTFTSKCSLIKHMSQHFNWFCFQCSKCSFMSYDRRTCIKHVDVHKIQPKLLDNIVLPIPHWKTVNLCTNFKKLSDQAQCENEDVNSTKKEREHQKSKAALTETDKTDPMLRKMIMEVIFGSESQSKESIEKSELTENVRPIRNRTSIQKKQKDFVYDMKQIDMKPKKSSEAKVKPIKIVKGVDTNFKVVRAVPNDIYKKKRKIIE